MLNNYLYRLFSIGKGAAFGGRPYARGVLLIDPRRKSEKISVALIQTKGAGVPSAGFGLGAEKLGGARRGRGVEVRRGQWLPAGLADFSV